MSRLLMNKGSADQSNKAGAVDMTAPTRDWPWEKTARFHGVDWANAPVSAGCPGF